MGKNVSAPVSSPPAPTLAPRWWVRLCAFILGQPMPAVSADPVSAEAGAPESKNVSAPPASGPVAGWLQDLEDQNCGVAYLQVRDGGGLVRVLAFKVRPLHPKVMVSSGRLYDELREAFGLLFKRDQHDDMALAAADAKAAAEADPETPEQKQARWQQWAQDMVRQQITHIRDPGTEVWRPVVFVDEFDDASEAPGQPVRFPMPALGVLDYCNVLQAARRPLQEVAGRFGPFLRE